MEQRISVLTIGADDFNAMKIFYKNILGWESVAENQDIVFYKLNGFLLSILSVIEKCPLIFLVWKVMGKALAQ